jgi:hypothetical protein
VWSLRKQWPLLWVGCSFLVINIIIWGTFYDASARFWATLALFAIVPVAYFIEDITIWLRDTQSVKLHWVLPVGVLLPGVILVARLDYVLAQPDTRTVASNWIEKTLPPDTAIISNVQLLELTPSVFSLQQQNADFPNSLGTFNQWLLEQPAEAYPSPAYDLVNADYYWFDTPENQQQLMAKRPINYAVIQSDFNELSFQTDPVSIYAFQHGIPELVVCPGSNFETTHLPLEGSGWAWQTIWQFERSGPIVLVFKLTETPTDLPIQQACP